jgi:FkbM family methyltransferase
MTKSVRNAINTLLHKIGFDIRISRFPVFETLGYYVKRLGVEVVIDVGANEGQFGEELRLNGFTGRIISFEPQQSTFAVLKEKISKDKTWECHNIALGAANGTSVLNVSKNSVFSSFLKMSESVGESGYGTESVSQEEITVKTLDTVWPALGCERRCTMLKTDTQGFDMAVLRGAAGCLSHIQAVQMEIPLRSMYSGQPTIDQILPELRALGFCLLELTKVCRASVTGELLEMDGLFVRSNNGSQNLTS